MTMTTGISELLRPGLLTKKHGGSLSDKVSDILAKAKPKDNAVERALSLSDSHHKSGVYFHGGVKSHVAGRTDHLPINVMPGSYVIPADIVSGLGEGNTLAGQSRLSEMFGGPHDGAEQKYHGRVVPIIVAGGEYVLSPVDIKKIGDGDIEAGHQMLDRFVKDQRKKVIKLLQKLPNPKKD